MRKQSFWKRLSLKSFKLIAFAALASGNAFASSSGSSLPFVSVLSTLAQAFTGPVALSISTILVVGTGLMAAFGEFGDGMKKFVNIAFWVSSAFGAVALLGVLGSNGSTF